MTLQLRDYQERFVSDVFNAWQSHLSVLGVMPTGAGKSVALAEIVRRNAEPTCIMVHRGELVAQLSETLALVGITHRVIASKSTVAMCVSRHVKRFGRSYIHEQSPVGVASVQTVVRRGDKLKHWLPAVKLVVADECFPAGTLIDTPNGPAPIELLQKGDTVVAYDEKRNIFENKKVVRLFKNPAPDTMYRVLNTWTTAGHPFWTRRGWVEAKDLKENDEIYVRGLPEPHRQSYIEPETEFQETQPNVLQPFLLDELQSSPQVVEETCGFGKSNMQELRGDFSECYSYNMFFELSSSDQFENNVSYESKVCFCPHEDEQPHASGRQQGEDATNHSRNGTQAEEAWREWETSDQSRIETVRNVQGLWFCSAVGGSHGVVGDGIPDSLQNRLCPTEAEDSNRSGREVTRDDCPQRVGRKEGRLFDWKRVGRVEVQERTDSERIGDGLVYNIEVDEHHTYVANGIVVHNCHHYLAENQFGTAVAMFPNAKVLGVTATPDRCDRKSLARVQKTGLFDTMVQGPSPRWLIDQGFLAPYKYYAPPPSIKMTDEDISPSTGDYRSDAVRKKSHESRIVGDVVGTYQKYANGKQAIVFTVDVETAHEMANAFNAAGVKAAAISGKTPDAMRFALMDKFATGSIQVITQCELFSEGLDVKGVDLAILARPTQSLTMYRQSVGRALRPVYADGYDLSTREGRLAAIANSDKPHAIIIDHVEGYAIHKLPDAERRWSLIRDDVTRGKKNRDDEIPLRSCVNEGCWQPYPASEPRCPHCGYKPEPASRSTPEAVDGDIVEFSPELIARLSGEVLRVDGAPQIPHGASEIVRRSIEKRWRERSDAQKRLRDTIALWAGHGRDAGKDDSVMYREFFHRFGLDVLSAQALGATEAEALRQRVELSRFDS